MAEKTGNFLLLGTRQQGTETKRRAMRDEQDPREGLRESMSIHESSSRVSNSKKTWAQEISGKVIHNSKMLVAFVDAFVGGESYGALIIHFRWIAGGTKRMKRLQKTSKPDRLLCSMESRDVLSFTRGGGDERLLTGPPTDGSPGK